MPSPAPRDCRAGQLRRLGLACRCRHRRSSCRPHAAASSAASAPTAATLSSRLCAIWRPPASVWCSAPGRRPAVTATENSCSLFQISRTRVSAQAPDVLGRRPQVLLERHEGAAGVEVDQEPGGRADVDDLAHRAGRAVLARRRLLVLGGDPDLLGSHAEHAVLAEHGPGGVAAAAGSRCRRSRPRRRWPGARTPQPARPPARSGRALKTAIRSDMVSASSWSWVTNTKVIPTCALDRPSARPASPRAA